jgi:hypothetical protein
MNKTEALKFVEPQSQNVFLQLNDTPIASFKILGIEFPDDPNQVRVSVKVNGVVPGVGSERVVTDTWVWKGGVWMLRASATPVLTTMFENDASKRPSAPVRPDFQLAETVIDIGKHAQGDVVDGKIAFKGLRRDILVVRSKDRIPGLTLDGAVFTSATEGYIPYRWETTLLSQSVDKTIPLEAIANTNGITTVNVRFRATIDGKVGFKQVPDIVDPSKAGQVELQVQNVSKTPLKILSATSNSPFYTIDENVPESIDPGKAGSLIIRFTAQPRGAGASLALVLSEQLTASGVITVPLNIKIADVERPNQLPEVPPGVQVGAPPAGLRVQ